MLEQRLWFSVQLSLGRCTGVTKAGYRASPLCRYHYPRVPGERTDRYASAGIPEISFDKAFFLARSVAEPGTDSETHVVWRRRRDQLSLTTPIIPSLNLHPVQGDASRRLHTFRASDEVRVLVAKEGHVFILLEAGHHDAIYKRAERGVFVVNPSSRSIRFVTREVAAWDSVPAEPAIDVRGIFEHWGDGDLVEAGFDTATVDLLRACKTEDDLLICALDAAALERAIDLIQLTPQEWRAPPTLDDGAEMAEIRFRRAITEYGALAGVSAVHPRGDRAARRRAN